MTYIYIFFAFLVKKTSRILFFGPSFRKPARKALSEEIYLKNKDLFLSFLVKKTSGILIFGPSFRKPARKASSGQIYLKNKDLYATDL